MSAPAKVTEAAEEEVVSFVAFIVSLCCGVLFVLKYYNSLQLGLYCRGRSEGETERQKRLVDQFQTKLMHVMPEQLHIEQRLLELANLLLLRHTRRVLWY